MALRTNGADVKKIIDTTQTASEIEDAFIPPANLLVTQALGSNTDISSALKTEIEKWLSAHFVAIRDPRIQQEKMGDATDTYRGTIGANAKGLEATYYGQQAIALDPTGSIANLGKAPAKIMQINPLITNNY